MSLNFGTLEDEAPAADPEDDVLFLASYLIEITYFDAQGKAFSTEELKLVITTYRLQRLTKPDLCNFVGR